MAISHTNFQCHGRSVHYPFVRQRGFACSWCVYREMARYTAPVFFDSATAVTLSVANPSGMLQPAAGSPFTVGAPPQSAAVGDFNGDGDPDLVTANAGNVVTVLFGDGTGVFTVDSAVAVGISPVSVAVGDFNGDGNLDLVTANFGGNNVTVLLGDGSGGFVEAPGSPFAVWTNPQSIALSDFNGDGNLDIATANNGTNDATVLLGDGTGGFMAAAGSPFPMGLFPQSLAVGDVNGDGNPDLISANSGNNTVKVLLGNGSGGFTGGGAFPVGSFPQSVAAADFNGDGNLDIATANSGSNTVTVLLGNGLGGFTAAVGSPFAVGANPQSIAVVDINGDGKPDLVTANVADNTVTVLLGTGSGGFSAAAGSPIAAGSTPISLVAGDFNGDGRPDIATEDIGGNNVTVLLGMQAASGSVLTTTAGATIAYGISVPLTLAVTAGFSAPSGAATFLDGVTTLGAATQTVSPFLFSASGLTVGMHSLTAVYGGDPAASSSSSNTVLLTVTMANQTITFGALANKALGVAPFTVNATATSGLAVTFTSTTLPVCTVSGAIVTPDSRGICTIQASQGGDTNYVAASSVSQHFFGDRGGPDYHLRGASEPGARRSSIRGERDGVLGTCGQFHLHHSDRLYSDRNRIRSHCDYGERGPLLHPGFTAGQRQFRRSPIRDPEFHGDEGGPSHNLRGSLKPGAWHSSIRGERNVIVGSGGQFHLYHLARLYSRRSDR